MTQTQPVVFDLGNVLIEWDRRLLFEKLIADSVELQEFLDGVFTMDDNKELDRGTPLRDVAEKVAQRHPEKRDLVMAFSDRWIETLGGVIEGSVEILQELSSAGVPLYALTNWGKDTFAMIENDYPFFGCFDGMLVSGREGLIKPDPTIFHLLCERFGFQATDAVFIDDSKANIEAASSLGFDALLFESPEILKGQLAERGLLA